MLLPTTCGWLLVLLSLVARSPVEGGGATSQWSPCPYVFKSEYYYDRNQWFGWLFLRDISYGQSVHINVELMVNKAVTEKVTAKLSFTKTSEETIQDVIKKQPITLRVDLSVKNQIPGLVSITLNGRKICTGKNWVGKQVSISNSFTAKLAEKKCAYCSNDNSYSQPKQNAYSSNAYSYSQPKESAYSNNANAYSQPKENAYSSYTNAYSQPKESAYSNNANAYSQETESQEIDVRYEAPESELATYWAVTSQSTTTLPPTTPSSTTVTSTTPPPVTRPPTTPSTTTLPPTTSSSTTLAPTTPSSTTLPPTTSSSTSLPPTTLTSETTTPATLSPATLAPTTPPPVTEPPATSSSTTLPPTTASTTPPPVILGSVLSLTQEQSERPSINKTSVKTVIGCGTPTQVLSHLSINGTRTRKGQFPWASPIFDIGSSIPTYICGSTIITTTHLVTAAHCIYVQRSVKRNPSDLLTVPGMYNIDNFFEEDMQERNVVKIVIHDEYIFEETGLSDSDIAVVKVDEPIVYNNLVRPICLWNEINNQEEIVGLTGYVSGWGITEKGESKYPNYVTATIVDKYACANNLEMLIVGSSNLFCGDGHGSVPCTGDSGSGLVIKRGPKYFLRGVVSIGQYDPETLTCARDKYVLYTDVAPLRFWLSRVVKGT